MIDLIHAMAAGTRETDESEGRVYGWLLGTVTDVDTKLIRVKARIGKQGDQEQTDWLVQVAPGGVEALPRVGEKVGVIFQDGDPHRGAFFYFPQSTTQNRPTDFMLLATTFAGLYNDLATKHNTLVTKYNQLYTDVTNILVMIDTTGLTVTGAIAKATPAVPQTSSQDNDAPVGKIKASDGSVPSANASDTVCLSGRVKIGQ